MKGGREDSHSEGRKAAMREKKLKVFVMQFFENCEGNGLKKWRVFPFEIESRFVLRM